MQGNNSDKQSETRTSAQNRAAHRWFRQVACDLDLAGYEASETIKVPISFTEEIVKEYMFKPIAGAMYGKTSTTQLSKEELSSVVEQLQRLFAEKFGITTPFPSKEGEQ